MGWYSGQPDWPAFFALVASGGDQMCCRQFQRLQELCQKVLKLTLETEGILRGVALIILAAHQQRALMHYDGASRGGVIDFACLNCTIKPRSEPVYYAPTGRDVMTPMKFVVKYFSEIAIKSKPVRRRFVARLAGNLREVLQEIDPGVRVDRQFDRLRVETALADPAAVARLVEAMRHVSGISHILEVSEFPAAAAGGNSRSGLARLRRAPGGRYFAVRCKRHGSHPFTSIDVEREVGRALLAQRGCRGETG